jgi:glycosyltransferase involved in cell wall biosynthesis
VVVPVARRGNPGIKRIGMAVYGDISFDSRVQREAATLAQAGYDVTLVSLPSTSGTEIAIPGVRCIAAAAGASTAQPGGSPFIRSSRRGIRRVLAGLAFLAGYARNVRAWGRWAVETVGDVDAWHLHDLPALAGIMPRVARGTPCVYDSHELYVETGTASRLPPPARWALRRLEARLVRRASLLVTVNDGIAAVLNQRYQVRRTVVVHNCPPSWTPPERPSPELRERAMLPPEAPLILHHGTLAPERGIEVLLETMLQPGLEHAHLVLLGYGLDAQRYAREARDGRYGGRVHVVAAVPPERLLDVIQAADVGAMPLPGTTLNLALSTPNKLFECLAAGVPVIVSDLAGMRPIVDVPGGTLGAVVDETDAGSVASGIRSILDRSPAERADLRRRCTAAAAERWNWEHEGATLVQAYGRLDREPAREPR